jgi:leucyl-tRNA synthetase
LKLFEKGLAYEAEMPVNYCPNCQAVLADEEVNNGKCFRCGETVERKNVTQ